MNTQYEVELRYDLDTYYSVNCYPLTTYALSVMDAARKKEPKNAYCWNYCWISFDGLNPVFYYAGEIEDLYTDGLGFLVCHPNKIGEKK